MTFEEQVEAYIRKIGTASEEQEMVVAVAAHCCMLEAIFKELPGQSGHTLTFPAEICRRACGAVLDEILLARGVAPAAEKPGTGLVQ